MTWVVQNSGFSRLVVWSALAGRSSLSVNDLFLFVGMVYNLEMLFSFYCIFSVAFVYWRGKPVWLPNDIVFLCFVPGRHKTCPYLLRAEGITVPGFSDSVIALNRYSRY